MIQMRTFAPAAAVLLLAGCGLGGEDDKRTQPLRTYSHDVPESVHVVEFNDQVGPGEQTVTVPVSAKSMVVRFDCFGDGEKFELSASTLATSGGLCDNLVYGGGAGGTGTTKEPAAVKGQKVVIKVAVAENVHWSLSLDLAHDTATHDRLMGFGS